ncbi:unnamed protein product [Vitrella brassicaformis CCMP3155]|uniref:Uncharacterized protein n=1 Tax=Vitrella brassicaformis (strain CCMP3155) TaxID=1169540 RepID=A0A0G4FZQ2_VITBC|nr:unnamed protein product [Vitrella brassicaformis CCMP3155]|eukprot:CEM20500.1 unnamed protein product [Vitrella brassicaformis CCMP3155]
MGQKCSKSLSVVHDDCYTPPLVAEYQKPGVKCFKKAPGKKEEEPKHGICRLEGVEGDVCDETLGYKCKPGLSCSKSLKALLTSSTGKCKKR